MPRGCDHAVHVKIDGRHYIVEYDADGNVLRVKQRKVVNEEVKDVSWWTASSHVLGNNPNSAPRRVIAAARAKTAREDAAHAATP